MPGQGTTQAPVPPRPPLAKLARPPLLLPESSPKKPLVLLPDLTPPKSSVPSTAVPAAHTEAIALASVKYPAANRALT
jgi:hypothetical protein